MIKESDFVKYSKTGEVGRVLRCYKNDDGDLCCLVQFEDHRKHVYQDDLAIATKPPTLNAYPDVNRVELITTSGRESVIYLKDGEQCSVSFQDGGETLKVFIDQTDG